ncbi:MAG: YraN family protein [Clostridia bacterium]|nr:YraN family protein [Clostridia bacterium]
MKNNREFGYFGEAVAADHLRQKGYKIIARNYYAVGGELDVIARDDKNIVFCEVKTRYDGSSLRYGRPAAAVGARKRGSIVAAARQYLFDHPDAAPPRIDVIEITVFTCTDVSGGKWYIVKEINQIENAVTASGADRFRAVDRRTL